MVNPLPTEPEITLAGVYGECVFKQNQTIDNGLINRLQIIDINDHLMTLCANMYILVAKFNILETCSEYIYVQPSR